MRDSQIQDIKEREEIYKNHDKSDIHLTLARIAARSVHASSFFLNNRPKLFAKYDPNHDDIVYMKETAKQLEKYPLLNDEENMELEIIPYFQRPFLTLMFHLVLVNKY